MKLKEVVFYGVCLFFIIISSSQIVEAIKIGAGPQEIILDKTTGKFTVFNPNPENANFRVIGERGMSFNQTSGMINANSKADIELSAFNEGNVIIKFIYDNFEPGVQLKVRKPDIPNYGIWIFAITLFGGIAALAAILFCSSI